MSRSFGGRELRMTAFPIIRIITKMLIPYISVVRVLCAIATWSRGGFPKRGRDPLRPAVDSVWVSVRTDATKSAPPVVSRKSAWRGVLIYRGYRVGSHDGGMGGKFSITTMLET